MSIKITYLASAEERAIMAGLAATLALLEARGMYTAPKVTPEFLKHVLALARESL